MYDGTLRGSNFTGLLSPPPPLHASGRLPLDRVLPVIGVALRYASSMMAGYMFWKGMGGGEWVEVWVHCDSRDLVRRERKRKRTW